MKHSLLMKAVGLAAVAAFSIGAHAQSGNAAASGAMAASQPETSAASSGTASPASKAANRALAKKVHRALAKARGLDPTHIYVKVRDGAVTLTGSCTSQDQIDLAGKTAQGVAGVSSVSNRLSVKTSS
jgi:hyperosmotically inducible periplasmic protein